MLLHYQDDDTKMSTVTDQVKHWFQFWTNHLELRDRARRGRRAALRRLLYVKARSRSRWATGPTGALMLTPRDLGWLSRVPDLWVDNAGDEWQHTGAPTGSYTE
eukprot:5482418-Pyramimonas_sp.AAC.1